jgi:hypothetical protein
MGGIVALYFFYKNLLPSAYIELLNKTDIEVEQIIIEHSSGNIIHKGLKKNEKVLYPIYVKGEGSYSIEVIFVDKKLKSLELVGYLETGYNLEEIIEEDKINEHQVFRVFP